MTSAAPGADPRVAAALSRLEEADGREPADTVQVYDDVAERLAAVLSEGDGRGPGLDEQPGDARG